MDNSQPDQTTDSKSSKTKLIIIIAALVVLAVGGFLVFGSGDSTPPAEPDGDRVNLPADEDETSPDEESSAEPAEDNQAEVDGNAPVQVGPPGVSSQPAPPDDGQEGDQTTDSGLEAVDQSAALAAGRYIDYQDRDQLRVQLAELAGQERWLNFHADWCPQCRSLDADINANLSQIPAGVTIVKVDYDDNQDLRQEYGVTQQTTFVRIGPDDQVAASYTAYSQPTLANVIDGLGYTN